MREELKRIQSELGITVIFVTHDQEEAMAISHRIVVMNKENSIRSEHRMKFMISRLPFMWHPSSER